MKKPREDVNCQESIEKRKGRVKMRIWKEPERFFPPGYEYRKEWYAAGLLYVLGIALNLQFIGRLWEAAASLYYENYPNGMILREGAVADSYFQVLGDCPGFWLPFYLFLIALIFLHYAYYLRETKSIYLMRRLPHRKVLWKSCLQAPLMGLGLGTTGILVLYLIYYVVYLLMMPAESLPRLI